MAKDWTPIAKVYDPLKAGSIDGTDSRPHDNGIERALRAEYYPNKRVVGNPKLTLFVARLNPKTTEETIRQTFSKFGEIVHCRLVRDIVTGFSRCYAFIEFSTERDVYKAYRDANKTYLEGSEIFVDFECERTLENWVPRRFGGGFGGKKESGQLRFGGRDRPFRKPILLPANKKSSNSFNWLNRRNDHKQDKYTDNSSDKSYHDRKYDDYKNKRRYDNYSRKNDDRHREKFSSKRSKRYDDTE